jgi:antitoxin PrlF
MRVTEKGQVTVPIEVRQKLGILPNMEVEFVLRGKQAILRKATHQSGRGQRLISYMRGRATRRMTTDQIMALTRHE